MGEVKKRPDEKVREHLLQRQRAYVMTFNRESEAVRAVLEDFARFCRADETTFHENERIQCVLEGRREVFLRIMDHLGMKSEDLYLKYAKGARV